MQGYSFSYLKEYLLSNKFDEKILEQAIGEAQREQAQQVSIIQTSTYPLALISFWCAIAGLIFSPLLIPAFFLGIYSLTKINSEKQWSGKNYAKAGIATSFAGLVLWISLLMLFGDMLSEIAQNQESQLTNVLLTVVPDSQSASAGEPFKIPKTMTIKSFGKYKGSASFYNGKERVIPSARLGLYNCKDDEGELVSDYLMPKLNTQTQTINPGELAEYTFLVNEQGLEPASYECVMYLHNAKLTVRDAVFNYDDAIPTKLVVN